MRRREFITLLGGVAAAWPLAGHTQQPDRARRIAVLVGGVSEDDPRGQARKTAILEWLQQSGWADGRNARIDFRWGLGSADSMHKYAAELIALRPEVILASGNAAVGVMLQATHTVPIVFALVVDPVGDGFVDSLSQPGGSATGFMFFEYSLSGKWLELLKEIAPNLRRVAVLRDSAITAGIGQFAVIESVASPLGVEVIPIKVRDAAEIERRIADFARSPNGGLIVTASALAVAQEDLIISLAARHKLPAVYYEPSWADDGGLIAYGPDIIDQFRRAASYVDRILKGEKPGDLPVQAPTKYQLTINLKTAKAVGLAIPATLLARADKVIE